MHTIPSFNKIYEDHVDMVFNLCLSYLQNSQDAEEVCQDVFVKVHGKLSGFSGNSSIRTWIYRIAINSCLDAIKAKKRQKRGGLLVSIFSTSGRDSERSATLPEIPDFDHPGVKLEDQEALSALFIQINNLPDQQRTAIILKAIDGLPQQEMAEVMQLSTKAVESLLSRAKANLKEQRRN